jgi:hypothetical protein
MKYQRSQRRNQQQEAMKLGGVDTAATATKMGATALLSG